jgi:hypothetical protein
MKDSDFVILHEIRKRLEDRLENFPHNYCKQAAIAVKNELGWKMIPGVIMDPLKRRYLGEHYWNYNPEAKEYIDLTLDQFHELERFNDQDVTIMHKNSKLAKSIYRPRYQSDVI